MKKRVSDPDLLRRSEAAELLGVSPRTLDRWARQGVRGVVLRTVVVGAQSRYRLEDIEEFHAEIAARRKLTVGRGVLSDRKDRKALDARWKRRGLVW